MFSSGGFFVKYFQIEGYKCSEGILKEQCIKFQSITLNWMNIGDSMQTISVVFFVLMKVYVIFLIIIYVVVALILILCEQPRNP